MSTKATYLTLSGLLIIMFLVSACTPVAQAAHEFQATPTAPQRTISVTGSAQVKLIPDIAYISIGVHTENADAAEAVASNTSRVQEVIDAIIAQGVEPEDIQTSNFSIYPQQEYGPNGETLGIKFVVDNTVVVNVRNLTTIGDILGAAVDAGANNIYGVSFDVIDRQAANIQARQAAIENAEAQASAMAEAAGVELGQIQSINAYSGSAGPIYDYKYGIGGAAEAAAPVPISAGQLVISMEVNVVYEIK